MHAPLAQIALATVVLQVPPWMGSSGMAVPLAWRAEHDQVLVEQYCPSGHELSAAQPFEVATQRWLETKHRADWQSESLVHGVSPVARPQCPFDEQTAVTH